MIRYFLKLIEELKTTQDFNVINEYRDSTFCLDSINWLHKIIKSENSIQTENGLYEQPISKGIYILWKDNNNKKELKELHTDNYSLIIGIRSIIVKLKNSKIKDLRYNILTGFISKINFVKSYFINFVDFCSGKVSMSIEGFKIKEFFQKEKLSELTKEDWELLEVNTLY